MTALIMTIGLAISILVGRFVYFLSSDSVMENASYLGQLFLFGLMFLGIPLLLFYGLFQFSVPLFCSVIALLILLK